MTSSENGIETISSAQSVDATVAKLQRVLAEKGVKLFAIVDHSGEAAAAGLAMRPTKLVIFGSPKAGTPIMVAAPTAALDLPLKILVAEDENGKTAISYNRPAYLRERHGFPAELEHNIAAVVALAAAAAAP